MLPGGRFDGDNRAIPQQSLNAKDIMQLKHESSKLRKENLNMTKIKARNNHLLQQVHQLETERLRLMAALEKIEKRMTDLETRAEVLEQSTA